MTKDDSLAELQRLRAEVAELKAAQQVTLEEQSAQNVSEPAVKQQAVEDEESVEETSQVETEQCHTVETDTTEQQQLDELKSLLAKEIKDLPTVTTLAVFSLGLLMGRYLR